MAAMQIVEDEKKINNENVSHLEGGTVTVTINYLTDIPLLYIFKFLDIKEVYRLGRVCKRWHYLTRHFLEEVTSYDLILTSKQFKNLKLVNQSAITSLKISFPSSLSPCVDVLQWFDKLSIEFPRLKKMMLINVLIPQDSRICSSVVGMLTPVTSLPPSTINTKPKEMSLLRHSGKSYNDSDFCDSDSSWFGKLDEPGNLRILSLRDSKLCPSVLFSSASSKVEVLDFNNCSFVDNFHKYLASFQQLREVYLSYCSITDTDAGLLLSFVPSITVLDLEGTDFRYFSLLKEVIEYRIHRKVAESDLALEKLYLGRNRIYEKFDPWIFPHLKELCLRNAVMREDFLLETLHCDRNHPCVNVGRCISHFYKHAPRSLLGKLQFACNGLPDTTRCDHFLENHK